MARGRRYHGRQNQEERLMPTGDALGFHYPPLPAGGSRQVLGSMPTDPNITPPIPVWLPMRHHFRWSEIWHGRQKQYKFPGSKELIPWDTTHEPMGDYQGHGEYYVEGCFGYDENGKEIRYRPGLPRVHIWSGRGLAFAPPWVRPIPPTIPYVPFNLYESTAPFTQEVLNDLQLVKSSTIGKQHQVEPQSACEIIGFSDDSMDAASLGLVFDDDLSTSYSSDSSSQEVQLAKSFDTSVIASAPGSMDSISVIPAIKSTETPISIATEKANLTNIPGELRNQIYEYLFQESSDFEIVWCSRQKDLTHWKHKVPLDQKEHKTGWRRIAKLDPSLDQAFERPVKNTKATTARRRQARQVYGGNNQEERVVELQAAGPAALLLTCKKMYQEAMPLFYQSNNFSFSSRSLLREFMERLSPRAMASIGKIYIAHDPQACPAKTETAQLIEKEYGYWIEDLKKMVKSFTGLRELTMLLRVRDLHLDSGERAVWAMGLRRGLAGLQHLGHFKRFDLVIHIGCDTSNVAWAEAYGSATQKLKARDLDGLVCSVKAAILEPIH